MDMTPRIIAEPEGPRWDALQFMGIGAAVMSTPMWARHQFIWWPLNPLGFTIAANWKTGHIFCSALLAWLIKALTLRYGGIGLYRALLPFFLGLALGEFATASTWVFLDGYFGHQGNMIFNR